MQPTFEKNAPLRRGPTALSLLTDVSMWVLAWAEARKVTYAATPYCHLLGATMVQVSKHMHIT